jgi:N-acetylmuramoyl-L-alanine amidase
MRGMAGTTRGRWAWMGFEEKDVVLDVALRLGKLLHDRLGAEIIYTRSDDTFIPLETRTAIANKAQADLFLSIHANSRRMRARAGWRRTT